jgi:hypothetical protein
MKKSKTIDYVDISKLESATEKGTSKATVVTSYTGGITMDSKPWAFVFKNFTFTDGLAIKSAAKTVVMYDQKNIPEEVDFSVLVNNKDYVVVSSFREDVLEKILADTDIVVSHNASFTYHFLTKVFEENYFSDIPFACTLKGIDFAKRKINSYSLEFLAYKYDFWYEPMIGEEPKAIIQLLQKDNNFVELVERLFLPAARIVLKNTSFNQKDDIKALGYQWNPIAKDWYKNEVENVEEEIERLKVIQCEKEVIPISPEQKYKIEGM